MVQGILWPNPTSLNLTFTTTTLYMEYLMIGVIDA